MADKEIISSAISIANEMRDKNNILAEDICDDIIDKIDIGKYNSIDTRVMVMVWVMKWNDVYSSWWHYEFITSQWHSEIDLYRFRLQCEQIINNCVNDLRV